MSPLHWLPLQTILLLICWVVLNLFTWFASRPLWTWLYFPVEGHRIWTSSYFGSILANQHLWLQSRPFEQPRFSVQALIIPWQGTEINTQMSQQSLGHLWWTRRLGWGTTLTEKLRKHRNVTHRGLLIPHQSFPFLFLFANSVHRHSRNVVAPFEWSGR